MMLAWWFTLTFTSSAAVLCLTKVSLKCHLERPEVCFGQLGLYYRLYIHLNMLGCCLSREQMSCCFVVLLHEGVVDFIIEIK